MNEVIGLNSSKSCILLPIIMNIFCDKDLYQLRERNVTNRWLVMFGKSSKT